VRRKEWIPARADREHLSERLFYEVQMTFFLAERLAESAGRRVDLSTRNAQIEALTLHLRQLVDFFWDERRRVRDDRAAFAIDYFERGEWARIRPARAEIIGRAFGWEMAPLDYTRRWAAPTDKVWDLISAAFALAPVVRLFADRVDAAQFPEGYVGGMKMCVQDFGGAYGASAGSESLAA
jgi:hypothetical protein